MERIAVNESYEISRARLANLPAFKVYEELRQKASTPHAYFKGTYERFDEETEQALLRRSDPLINLALAQFGGSSKVGAKLYFWSRTEEQKNPEYWRAIRQALLRNKEFPPMDQGLLRSPITDDDIAELFRNGSSEDVSAVLKNPSAGALLARLYNREKPFQSISDEELVQYVHESWDNPCISEPRFRDEFGSDDDFIGIQKGIWSLLKTLPTTQDAMRAMGRLLLQVDPWHAYCPDEDPLPALQRWESVVTAENPGKTKIDLADSFTGYGDGMDFGVLASALYGRHKNPTESGKQEKVGLGNADSPYLLLRCAYYGQSLEKLITSIPPKAKPNTVEWARELYSPDLSSLRAAYQRDGDVFVFAALCSESAFRYQGVRALLEECLRGRTIGRYWERCKQIQKRKPDFDITPVSIDGRRKLKNMLPVPTDDQRRIQLLEADLANVRKSVAALSLWIQCVLVLLIILMIMLWWRT